MPPKRRNRPKPYHSYDHGNKATRIGICSTGATWVITLLSVPTKESELLVAQLRAAAQRYNELIMLAEQVVHVDNMSQTSRTEATFLLCSERRNPGGNGPMPIWAQNR
jgi:hypothetical protein